MPKGFKITEQVKAEMTKLYVSGCSCVEVAQKLGLQERTISRHLRKAGIKIRGRDFYRSRYVDENFFEVIDSEYKAYWLGFLMADGNVFAFKRNDRDTWQYGVNLKLSITDMEHLVLFRKYLKSEATITTFETHYQPYGRIMAQITIYSRKIACDLINHGCTPKKSLKLIFPSTVPDKLISHLIRGYFDGDGSISYNTKLNSWILSMEGTESFLTKCQEYLVAHCGVRFTKIINGHGKSKSLRYCGNKQVRYILDWLYQDATIYLERKYNRYKELCKMMG